MCVDRGRNLGTALRRWACAVSAGAVRQQDGQPDGCARLRTGKRVEHFTGRTTRHELAAQEAERHRRRKYLIGCVPMRIPAGPGRPFRRHTASAACVTGDTLKRSCSVKEAPGHCFTALTPARSRGPPRPSRLDAFGPSGAAPLLSRCPDGNPPRMPVGPSRSSGWTALAERAAESGDTKEHDAMLIPDTDCIISYTRAQAIEDGILFDVTPMAREAGLKYPVALTQAAWALCVVLSPAAERAHNDQTGRLWDVLWMLRVAAKRARAGASEIVFAIRCVTTNVTPSHVARRTRRRWRTRHHRHASRRVVSLPQCAEYRKIASNAPPKHTPASTGAGQ
jgi:hypothetical protein